MKLTKLHVAAAIVWGATALPVALADDRVSVPAGKFVPQYGPGGSKKAVSVAAFQLDRVPVTRKKFAEFLRANPEWMPEAVSRTFAEKGYLGDWKGRKFPEGTAEFPVTHVSYFASAAFCEWKGGRLPTVVEWEYVAAAGKKMRDGSKDVSQVDEWIKQYSSPQGVRPVGNEIPNFYGIQNLHGMVWEWTMDYNSSFVTSDNRQDGEMTKNFFCGSASTGAADRANYPAFMRYAMRGGLRPNYTIANLGFRCAYDKK